MLPLLKIASDEADHNHAEVRDSLAVHFEISDSEKKKRCFQAGKQARLTIGGMCNSLFEESRTHRKFK